MATIIDSLVVKLGLDSKEFAAGKTKVDKGLKDTSKGAKEASASFTELASNAAKFLAILGGTAAVKNFIEDAMNSSAALDRLSKNLGESAGAISQWGNAAELAGGTAQGLQGTMDMLSRSQTELMLTGQSSLIPFFSALGVSLADASGKAKPANDIFLALSDRFSGMDRTAANNMGRSMGIDQGTMNLLLSGRHEVELMLKRQKEYGDLMNKIAPQGSKLNRMLIEGKQAAQFFGLELFASFIPAIEKLFDIFSDVGVWAKDNKEFIGDFLAILAGGLTLVGIALIPINLWIVGFTALAVAFGLFWQDYQTWARGGQSSLPWGDWVPQIDKLMGKLSELKELVADAAYRVLAFGHATAAALSGDWKGMAFAMNEYRTGRPTEPTTGSVGGSTQGAGGDKAQYLAGLEQKYGIPKGIMDTVWSTESGRGKNMNSPAGAQGHFQFMPATAKQYGVTDPYNFEQSADGAARMYRDLIQQNGGDVGKAAAAYNWGPGNLARKGMGAAPTETVNYVSKIMRGISGASGAAAGAGAGNAAMASAGNRSSTTNIRDIIVNSSAPDAKALVQDIQQSKDYLFVSQSNNGLM